MAQQRVKAKTERPSRSSDGARHRQKKTTAAGDQSGPAAEMKRERDDARAELALAKKRITELESQHEQVVNRIDWVIDSLHMMKDESD
jgi:hypothetical protein